MDSNIILKKPINLSCLIVILMFMIINSSLAQNFTFSADSVLDTGYSPESIISEDFNNDTHPDLAVAMRVDPSSHHVAIYFNDGNGEFSSVPDSSYLVGDFPRGIAKGDFNNDNILDLVTANVDDSSLTILFGNGDGTFGNIDSLEIPNKAEELNVGDFDNDQNDDIAVITRFAQLFVYKGNGDGTFSLPDFFPAGGTGSEIQIFDINNDNYLDLILGLSNSANLKILLNDGTGDFSNSNNIYTYSVPWYVEVCDLNSDSYPDIVTGSGSIDYDNVISLLGDAQGGFTISDTSSPGTYVNDIVACDLNADSIIDVLVGDRNGIYILTGNGYGSFGKADTIDYDASNYRVEKMIAKDLNSDNKPDLIIARDNKISIYYNYTVPNSVKDESNILQTFKLYKNYPNPFNPVTNIKYELPFTANVVLNIYNISGQKVATLVNGLQNAGSYTREWNASDFASGSYFYELKFNKHVQVKKMLYLK